MMVAWAKLALSARGLGTRSCAGLPSLLLLRGVGLGVGGRLLLAVFLRVSLRARHRSQLGNILVYRVRMSKCCAASAGTRRCVPCAFASGVFPLAETGHE